MLLRKFKNTRLFSTTTNLKEKSLGFLGLGKIGYAMANNFLSNNYGLLLYDLNESVVDKLCHSYPNIANKSSSVSELSMNCDILVSVLPNDEILMNTIENSILHNIKPNSIHICCSTISPHTARKISQLHLDTNNTKYVSAPVFARPDGMSLGQSTIAISGDLNSINLIKELLLTTSTGIYEFGTDPGAANIVKLCGNYCIASSIQTISEALALAENNNINRQSVISLLTNTIFNCLIYNGYGNRVSLRDHTPYENAHFSLQLGYKDINLILDTADKSSPKVNMPVCNILKESFSQSIKKGRNDLDWSAIGLHISENCGINVNEYEKQCRQNDNKLHQ